MRQYITKLIVFLSKQKTVTKPANFSVLGLSLIAKFTLASTIIFIFFTIVYLFLFFSMFMQLHFLKTTAIWFSVLFFVYWICAAIWCLYDKDDYGRNVSASNDFYNIAFTSLWLIEGFLLSLFLSYTKLFDYYEPLLEPEEIESSFRNEEADGNVIITALYSFLTVQYVTFVLDSLLVWEATNPFWLCFFILSIVLVLIAKFAKTSVKFLEEFDFEEDGDDLFDDVDNVFEHEDFPEEGVDGGDYAEGYEILQLFFGYWHYMFISLHICYLCYAVYASQGKESHVYWAVIAICQNLILILILDMLDWGEVLINLDANVLNDIYSWFYINEDPTNILLDMFLTTYQIIEYIFFSGDLLGFYYFYFDPIYVFIQNLLVENANQSHVIEEYTKIATSLQHNNITK